MLISLAGAPGSGKGTVAQMLEEEGWLHFSMGQALREHVNQKGKFAKIIGKLNAKGILSPNRIVMPIFDAYLSGHKNKNIVLDGYPRNLGQVKGLSRVLHSQKVDLDAFILLDVSKELLVKRLSSRRTCSTCGEIYGLDFKPTKKGKCDKDGAKLIQRNDDKPSVIRHRFSVYLNETIPVIEWASGRYPIYRVSGEGSPRAVYKRVRGIISLITSSNKSKIKKKGKITHGR